MRFTAIRSFLGNLGLRQKLVVAVCLVLLASSIATAAAFRASDEARRAFEDVTTSQEIIQETVDLQSAMFSMQFGFRGYLLTGDAEFTDTYASNLSLVNEHLALLQDISSEDQRETWRTVERLLNEWRTTIAEPGLAIRADVDAAGANPQPAVDWVTATTSNSPFTQALAGLNSGLEAEQQVLAGRLDEVERDSRQVRRILLIGGSIVGIISLASAWLTARDVGNAMRRFTYVAGRVAQGDYGQRVNLRRTDEIGQTATAFDSMTRTLNSTIIDLNEAADRARRSESHTRSILDNVSEGIFTFTSSGIVDSVNPAAREMFGFEDDAIIGLPVGTIVTITPEGPESGEGGDSGHNSVHQEALGHRFDGSSFPIDLSITRMDVPGAPRFIAVARNISEIVEAERRLRRRNRELENLRSTSSAMLNSAGEALILISPQHTILRINDRFAEFFGVQPQQVIDRPMKHYGELLDRIFVDPDAFRRVLYATIDDPEAQDTGQIAQQWPVARELEFVTRPVSTSGGEYLGRLFAFRDVTHEREVDRMKTEFVSLVSHELRTPLTSIKGYVDLLLEGEVGELTAEQGEFLQIVGSNADRLVALIGDLLDISRIESGKIDLTMTANDVRTVLDGLAMSFRPQLESRHQALVLEVPADIPPVAADTARLNQILSNLLSNAHKYSPPGSQITVRVGHLDDRISIAVRDQGVGMNEEELGKLFTRFYRARNRATEEAGGTGLGLAITRSLVELQGGSIGVESTPGQGSVFTISLPVANLAPAVPAPVEEAGHTTGCILIVEDEPDIARLIRRYLERAGFQVKTTDRASAALEMARSTSFDLITLDVRLPDSDGFTVLEALKADEATRDIPVMMLSMLPDEGEGRRLGAVDYLVKPIQEHTLVAHIGDILATAALPPRGTILVADDDADIRNLIAHHLGRSGYRVLPAANGAEVLDHLETETEIDLVLLDVRMPVLDGIETLLQMRAMDRTRDVPVVMMTASPGAIDDIRPTLSLFGVTELLQKPLTAEQLAQALERTLHTLRTGTDT